MAKRLVFLQLAPEFGGQKFGPFAGAEIRLGSDPGRSDIALNEALGVAREHARLVKQADETFILAPVDRTAHVFLFRVSGGAPKEVKSPVALQTGDSFSLVSAEGPRFIVVLENQKVVDTQDPAAAKGGLGKAASKLNAGTLMAEIKRQGIARTLATGAGQAVSNAWTFIKSGTILQPRYLIMGAMMVFGGCGTLLVGGGLGGGLGMFKNNQTQEKLDSCNATVEVLSGDTGGGGEKELPDYVNDMLGGERFWKQTLEDDQDLRRAVYKQLKNNVFAHPDRYKWVYKPMSNSPFVLFRKTIEKKGFPKGLVRTFAYTAALEGYVDEREWELVRDAQGRDTCARGPLLMTWRQGSNLKLEYLQYDAVFDSAVMRAGDLDAAMGALRAAAGQPDLTLDQTLIQTATFSGGQCFYVDGEDYRTSATDLVPALAKELDGKAKGLPDETSPHWPAMRLLKFYAADFEKRDYDQLNFNDGGTPSAALAGATKLTPGHRTWAIDRMAETLARAIGIPCIAIRDKTVQAPVEEVVKDAPKSKITCHVIRSMVEEEEL